MLEIYTENMTAQVTKKPAGLAPCGLLGLHRMTLVITDGEFWGWLPCVLYLNDMIFIVIFVTLFIKGSIKGPKKRQHRFYLFQSQNLRYY
ncbi:hypothetical protein B6J66_19510 [Klebsiella quasipneumoniae]|nr:hypothetical protein B6J66_19510 [Klebsiella quasipneumoniae]